MALQACQAKYGSCHQGQCGNFFYYYGAGHRSCDCSKQVGHYEFVYRNTGYHGVGLDYGGSHTDVNGDHSFVRVKSGHSCGGNSWSLALKDFGVKLPAGEEESSSRKLLEVAKTEATAASPKGKCWCGHDSLAMKKALKGDIEAESAPQICTFMTSPLADAAMIASQKDAIAEIASAKTRVARANFGVVTATAKQLEAAKSVAQTANENLNIVETEATANNKEDIPLTPESIAVNANVQKENARLASLKGKLDQLEIETSKMRGKVIAINGLMRENQVIKKEVVLSQDAILPKLADAEVP